MRARIAAAVLCGTALIAAAVPGRGDAAVLARVTSGSTLEGWTVASGDSSWAPAGVAPVSLDDLGVQHLAAGRTDISVNTRRRPVMVHAIVYRSESGADQLRLAHRASVNIQLPAVPTATEAGQTVEVGLFVWDGATTRRDYGTAVQWVVNPGDAHYGELRTWSADGWVTAGQLTPDATAHRVELAVDPVARTVQVLVDRRSLAAVYTATAKPSSWGSTVAARFQVEAISMWPRPDASAAPASGLQAWGWSWRRVASLRSSRSRVGIRWG